MWTPTVPAWAPIRPSLPGRARTLAAEPEAAGVLRPLRMVVWVTEGGRRLTEGSRLREEKVGGGGDPAWGRGWCYPWGRGLGRPPLVLGKAGPGPLLQRGKGVWAQGVQGSWGLLALCWPGQGRFLGTGNQAAGVVRGGWEGTRPQQDSISGPPPPLPPLAWGCHRVKALSKTTETQRAGDQLGPTKLQSQQSPRFWPWCSG